MIINKIQESYIHFLQINHLTISSTNFTFLKASKSEFQEIEYGLQIKIVNH